MTNTEEQFRKTEEQFKSVMQECRVLFEKKLHDYGASWRILRPSSLTDQLFIKAKRIRSLETTGTSLVGEGIRPEFIALINYGIIGLIQLEHGFVDTVDIAPEEAMQMYDTHAKECLQLMLRKNHDYNEAWRDMRVSSYTDFILRYSALRRWKTFRMALSCPRVSTPITWTSSTMPASEL